VGFVERAARSFKAQAGVARSDAEAFGAVQRDAAQRAANLRCEITIAPSDLRDEWPSQSNDLDDLVQKLLIAGSVHALFPPRSFRDTASLITP
jgi:hypothetical protein